MEVYTCMCRNISMHSKTQKCVRECFRSLPAREMKVGEGGWVNGRERERKHQEQREEHF